MRRYRFRAAPHGPTAQDSGASARRATPRRELPPCASRGGRSTRSIVVHSHYRCAAGGDLPEMQVPKKSQASTGTPKGLHRVLRSVRVVWCAEYRGQRRAHIHSTEARASKHTQGSKRAASPPYSGGGEIAATSVTSAASLSGSEPCQPWPCRPALALPALALPASALQSGQCWPCHEGGGGACHGKCTPPPQAPQFSPTQGERP